MYIFMKIMGSVLVLGGCGCCGWYLAYLARKRIEILQELQQAMLIIAGEIAYAAEDMEQILWQTGNRMEYFSTFFMEISRGLHQREGQSLYQIWSQKMEKENFWKWLKEEDLLFLEELGRNLGNLDRQTQLHTLQVMDSRLEERIKRARDEYGNRARVYRVVGIAAGTFVVVLLL